MTMSEIKESTKPYLLAKDVAEVLGSDQQTIRVSAKLGVLGFPVFYTGNRLKIPRIPFLRYMGEL